MKRSDAYYVIWRFIRSGLVKQDIVNKLYDLRKMICSGKDVSKHDALMLLWVFAHEEWIDKELKEHVTELIRCCYEGFEKCDMGVSHSLCGECPYNDHFSWE